MRLNPDGSLDRDFAKRGRRAIKLPLGAQGRIAVDDGVRPLLTWDSGQELELLRLTGDGRADRSFGSRDVVRTELEGSPEELPSIAIDERGRAVVALSTYMPEPPGGRIDLFRYLDR